MSKNLEKQGKRIGYIIGGIFALILGVLLVLLYFPSLMTALFGMEPIWDLSETFAEVFGANFMDMIAQWGLTGILLLMGGVYFICLFARPSANSTMLRLGALFGVLSLLIPALLGSIISMLEMNASDLDTLMTYLNYAVLAFFVLSFIFYLIGFILRFKQKFHKNRSSTVLVFASTFWMLLALFPALNVALSLFDSNVAFIVEASLIVSSNVLGFVGVFFIISAIWMFITYPHRVVVDYNPDKTRGKAGARPQIATLDTSTPVNAGAPIQPQQAQPKAPVMQNQRFEHNYTNPAMQQNSFASNPVLNSQPQVNAQSQTQQFAQQPQMQQPQPTVVSQPQQQFNQPNQQFAQQPQQPRPQFNPMNKNQNPYASFNNFTQNSPYNKPQPQPQPQRPMPQNQNIAQPRPNVAPQQQFNQPQQPRPQNQFNQTFPQQRPAMPQQPQQPRPQGSPFAPPPPQPARPAPRPPVTPFTGANNPNTAPKPNGNNNGTNGTNNAV